MTIPMIPNDHFCNGLSLDSVHKRKIQNTSKTAVIEICIHAFMRSVIILL